MSNFVTPRTVAYQAPLSTEFPRQVYYSGLLFPSPRNVPDQGLNPILPHGRQILYHLSQQRSPTPIYIFNSIIILLSLNV